MPDLWGLVYKKHSAIVWVNLDWLVTADLDRLLRPGVVAIVGGDFNSKHSTWCSRTSNVYGDRFYVLLQTQP